jgi:hypothetical protein
MSHAALESDSIRVGKLYLSAYGVKPGHECVRKDALSAGWKSPPRAVTACEVESNCAAAMRGGEQLEAKG